MQRRYLDVVTKFSIESGNRERMASTSIDRPRMVSYGSNDKIPTKVVTSVVLKRSVAFESYNLLSKKREVAS